jgi:hypothetical protein
MVMEIMDGDEIAGFGGTAETANPPVAVAIVNPVALLASTFSWMELELEG